MSKPITTDAEVFMAKEAHELWMATTFLSNTHTILNIMQKALKDAFDAGFQKAEEVAADGTD